MSCEGRDVTDQALTRHGLRRRLAMTAHHFPPVPQIVRGSNLIAVLPSTTIERAILTGEIVLREPPVGVNR